jgi:MscS family membrane protein
MRLGLGLALALATAIPAFAQLSFPSSAPPAPVPTPGEAEPEADPWGRETPRGCVLGFLRASRQGSATTGAAYLQIPASLKTQRDAIAREVQIVFDHRFESVNFDNLSRGARGSLDDGLDADLERVGEIRVEDGVLDVLVVRVASAGSGHIWLISWPTVRECRRLYGTLRLPEIDQKVPAFLSRTRIAGIALWKAAVFVVLLPILYGIVWIVVGAIVGLWRLIRPGSRATTGQWVASSRSPVTFLLALLFHRVAMGYLGLPALYRIYYDRVLLVLSLLGLWWLLSRLIDNLNRRVLSRVVPAGAGAQHRTLTLARRSLKLAAFLLIVLVGLAAFGVNLTATLAGLGIGGLALAFAAQKTLGNLFGGVALLTENSLRVGDTCRIGGQTGEIEDVTLWSTRIRTNERSVVSIPNGLVMESQIENLSRRDKYWFHPVVGLVYATTAAQMRSVLEATRKMLAADPRIETETVRVRFHRLSESSMDIEVIAYVRASTVPEFMEVQEELLLRLLEVVEAAGTSLAFPSRTIYLAGQGAAGPA